MGAKEGFYKRVIVCVNGCTFVDEPAAFDEVVFGFHDASVL
jgi:hypothetical protein